jgi:hypothetical protein
MAERTLAHYDSAVASRAPATAGRPFEWARVKNAELRP